MSRVWTRLRKFSQGGVSSVTGEDASESVRQWDSAGAKKGARLRDANFYRSTRGTEVDKAECEGDN